MPVLWPCSIFGLVTYQLEQETNSLEALTVFLALANAVHNAAFPRQSLMMHGMGNHLVLNGGCAGESAPEIRFEDIFLVAAVSTARLSFTHGRGSLNTDAISLSLT